MGQSAARTGAPKQHIIKMMLPRKTATNARLSSGCMTQLFGRSQHRPVRGFSQPK